VENQTALFTRTLPVAGEFRGVLEDGLYRPVPDDWFVALTDVVSSRQAIAAGRYKAVNMAGVATISALMNGLGTRDVPYIFGGDGGAILCAPAERALVEDILARTAAWVRDELDLTLRAALVPVAAVRAAGRDLSVQASPVSASVTNYAFRGGGLSWAESRMKAGEFAVEPGPPGARPDLTGLSCRWSPIRSEGEKIVSIIMEPLPGAEDVFPDRGRRLLELTGTGLRGDGSPADSGRRLEAKWPPDTLELEARAGDPARPLVLRRLGLALFTLFAWVLFRTGMRVGSFDPVRYKQFTSLNTDYRKFQDGLRVTVSLDDAELKRVTDFLGRERDAGTVRYGLCIQDSAILTCYVPSVMSDTHFHFLDGAGGGYAEAAENMMRS
jgi:hypothetical protein